ncbi:CubicO group peptidase, beta-lactamase class C family [bacterium A37T11]|nr:CubicO group peptidase, beta-lactamase class C family [bacterium A37T11]
MHVVIHAQIVLKAHVTTLLAKVLYLISFFGLLCAFTYAQENPASEVANQAVFNQIEYHINLKETDSIYAMAGVAYKKATSLSSFRVILAQIYPLGIIKGAARINFEKRIGTYKLDFNGQSLQLLLGLDSLNKIATLLFQPLKESVPGPADKKEPVAASNNRESGQDQFVDSLAMAYTRKSHKSALAIGIMTGNKTQRYFYGNTGNQGSQLPNDSTLFEIGSISKTFTATLLAYLAEKKQVSLDDMITKYLPDSLKSNPHLQRISLQQLGNHTSGLPLLPDNFEQVTSLKLTDPYRSYKLANLYSYLKNYHASVVPDSIYSYSNLGFGLLGTIISQVYSKSYNDMVKEIICKPIGLKNTTTTPDSLKQKVAKSYNTKGTELPIWNADCLAGAGALKSTVSDLLQYAKAETKLPETTLENAMAQTKQFTFQESVDSDVGLAWLTLMVNGVLVHWHNGGKAGSSSFLAFSPDKKTAVVVLSNTAESVDEMAIAIVNKLLGN